MKTRGLRRAIEAMRKIDSEARERFHKQGCQERGEHTHCERCGYPIAITARLCGECSCEDDAQ